MKLVLATILAFSLISCTKKSETSSTEISAAAANEVVHQDLPDPTADLNAENSVGGRVRIEIDIKDRACKKDSDCTITAIQCSCHCGEGVNKAHTAKYQAQMTELCAKEKNQMMCKKMCNGEAKCVNKVCAIQ